MTDPAGEFQTHRPVLHALAYRLLGSLHDAEDVVQDAYLRWSREGRERVREPGRYLTRVVTHLAIDQLRSRRARRESYVGDWLPEPVARAQSPFGTVDTSDLSLSMLHLMERLTPPQRAVYVLRTAFELPYGEIAEILALTPEHCRQLYGRAARALAAGRPRFRPSRQEQRRLLGDFVAAARDGDLAALTSRLRADVVAWSDGGGRAPAARNAIVGSEKVARFLAGIYSRPRTLRVAELDLHTGPALAVDNGQAMHILALEVEDGEVARLYLVANPDKLDAARAVASSEADGWTRVGGWGTGCARTAAPGPRG